MNWKKGDIAICVNITNNSIDAETYPPPLGLHMEYIVNNVYMCPKCGDVSIDVGFISTKGGTLCCTEKIPCKEIHWAAAERFVKKDTRSLEEQIEEAVSKEDYELANELKNKLE